MSKSMLKLVVNRDAVRTAERGEAPEEITKATIDRLAKRPVSGRDEYIQDADLPGFKLRRTRQGTIVFLFHGRVRNGEGDTKGKLVKRTLGRAKGKGAISISKARAEAVALRDATAKGIDPTEQLKAADEATQAAKRQREREATIREWTPAFALEHMLRCCVERKLPLRPETIEFYQRGIGYLGKLANVPIVDMQAEDIRKALAKVGGVAKPSKAKRALSGVISHAIKELNLNIANPVNRLSRGEFKAPEPRTSYIREADIGGFIRKVGAINIPDKPRESARARNYILLTLLYGTRKEELMRMRWDWIDWESGTFTIPATVTKQKRAHRLPLTKWTRAILEARKAANVRGSAYVFPGDKRGLNPETKEPIDQPVTNIRRSLISAVGEGFKLHDLRRTLTTHCASLGIHGSRMKAIVGHAKADVTENYDQREIEQVRRDLTTYHDWLEVRFETWRPAGVAAEMMEAAFGDMEAIEPPQPAKCWPGV